MTCEVVPTPDGAAIICSRGQRARFICDVCDRPVRKPGCETPWQGLVIDLCARCQHRRDEEPFREWSDRIIARHYLDQR